MTESTSAIEQAVAARIQAAKRRSEDMRRQRAALAAARRAGKAKAHAAKLRRQASRQQEASSRGDTATTVGQSPKVAKGTQIVRTPGHADDRTSSPASRGDKPTVPDLRGPEDHADVARTATTDEDQA